MKWLTLGIALFLLVPVRVHASTHAPHQALKTCRFKRALWPVVQQTAALVEKAAFASPVGIESQTGTLKDRFAHAESVTHRHSGALESDLKHAWKLADAIAIDNVNSNNADSSQTEYWYSKWNNDKAVGTSYVNQAWKDVKTVCG